MSVAGPRMLATREHPRRLERVVGEIVLLLVVLQAARGVVTLALSAAFPPGGDVTRFQAVNAVAFVAVGLVALVVARPSPIMVGLTLASASAIQRVWYLMVGAVLALMFAASLVLNPGQAGIALHFVVVLPAFEEILFRGYVWHKLAASVPGQRAALVVWLGTTVLFSLWHLGYADTLARHPAGADLLVALGWKLAIGAVLGLATGFLRWRTGSVLGPFMLHAFWNLMAP